jgi:hypothetical protein
MLGGDKKKERIERAGKSESGQAMEGCDEHFLMSLNARAGLNPPFCRLAGSPHSKLDLQLKFSHPTSSVRGLCFLEQYVGEGVFISMSFHLPETLTLLSMVTHLIKFHPCPQTLGTSREELGPATGVINFTISHPALPG